MAVRRMSGARGSGVFGDFVEGLGEGDGGSGESSYRADDGYGSYDFYDRHPAKA
jgi:hypothetical protein